MAGRITTDRAKIKPMIGLDDALVGVAVNLASGALTGAAKAAWSRLRGLLIKDSTDDRRVVAWLDLLEADPSEQLARQVADRLNAIGFGANQEVRSAAAEVGSQLAIGDGATNSSVGNNYGSIGGIHIANDSHQALSLARTGRVAYRLVNAGGSDVTVTGVRDTVSGREVPIPDLLPLTLSPGEGIGLILETLLGAGRPSIRVSYLLGGKPRAQTLITER